jgi:hypothetical protein
MIDKPFRCGYCGTPTDAEGNVLFDYDKSLDWDHAEQSQGECCREERSGPRGYVTRDMALDACEPDMEGMPIW